jgi:tetratricopeptide (TPR) repeat protein
MVTARYQDAIADWNAYLTGSGPSAAAYYWRGAAYNRIGSWKLALDDLDAYVGRKPDDADGYRERGFARAGKGDSAGASADFTEAARRYRLSGDTQLADQVTAFEKALSAGRPLPALPKP